MFQSVSFLRKIMKNKNEILLNEYIINSSDLYELVNNKDFDFKTKYLDLTKKINPKSKLIHKNNITLLELIIFNIDNYISFLKQNLMINQLEIRYIAYLTIYENNYLFEEKYYYDNIEYFNNLFKKILMSKYNKNVNILLKYKNINLYNYDTLLEKINKNKNRAYIYFEDINQNNALYYLNIYEYNDSI